MKSILLDTLYLVWAVVTRKKERDETGTYKTLEWMEWKLYSESIKYVTN